MHFSNLHNFFTFRHDEAKEGKWGIGDIWKICFLNLLFNIHCAILLLALNTPLKSSSLTSLMGQHFLLYLFFFSFYEYTENTGI